MENKRIYNDNISKILLYADADANANVVQNNHNLLRKRS